MRRDIAQAMLLPMFWVKLLVPALIAVAGFTVLQRLARPGARPGAAAGWMAAPVLLLLALAA